MGKVETLSHRAIFIDRDGVITKERHDYVKTVGELEMVPGAAAALASLHHLPFKLIVITNQSVINRGLTTLAELNRIHQKVRKKVAQGGGRIDAIYFCPHKPDENCGCRKPRTGLLTMASQEMGIDLQKSWFIGDKDSDMEAGRRAGCGVVRVRTNEQGGLRKAIRYILDFEKTDAWKSDKSGE